MKKFLFVIAAFFAATVGAYAQPAPSFFPGCVYNSTPPTLSDKQTTAIQCDSSGRVKTTGGGGASGLVVGTTTITGGNAGRVLYDNAGVLGETGALTTNALMLGAGTSGATVLGSLGTMTTVLHGNAAGAPTFGAVSLTADVSGVLPVANGGSNCSVASITCFNNITGFTASGATGTTSANLVFSTSPTLVTPVLGVAAATSLAIGGATIGSNGLAVTGTTLHNDNVGIATGGIAALAPLHVGNQNVINSVDAQILVSRTVSTGSGNAHAFSDSSNYSRAGTIGVNSYDARMTLSGAANFDHYAGFQAIPTYSSSGTITNTYGLYVGNALGAGVITTQYGVYVEPLTRGGSNFGLYIAGSGQAYIGGSTVINSTLGVNGLLSTTGGNGIISAGAITATLDLSTANARFIGFGARSYFSSPADGVMTVTNFAITDFGRFNFGGNTSSFPAAARNAAVLDFVLADNSTFTSIGARSLIAKGAVPTLVLAGGTCAGTVIAGGSTAGTVTLTGACIATNTLTLSNMPTATTGYACDAADRTLGSVALSQTSTTTTGTVFTFSATTGATDVIAYKCIAY